MIHRTRSFFKHRPSKFHQQGAALILMVFVLSLVLLAYMFKNLNGNDLRAKEAAITSQSLAEAKLALISWSVNHPNAPGLMPYPDRNADPLGYDGLSDCPGGATLYSHLIGRLPWKGADYNDCNILLSGLGKEFMDGSNEPLWYAISKNLVHIYSPSGDPVVNPSIIDNPPYDDNPPSKSWMRVFDKNGQLISDKVAVIIFAPGSPNADQDRSGGKTDATNYLDIFYLQSGGGAKSNRKYAGSNEDFYMGEDARGVRSDNSTYQQPYYFNDKLVYITIDELMAEVEKRAAGEARIALQKYYTNNSFYPYAAAPGSITNPNQCIQGNLQGLLPINTPSVYTCSCTSSPRTCSCSFATISSVSFTRTSGSYGTSGTRAPTGSCTVPTSNTCRCTGSGTCKQNNAAAPTRFSCDACGVCTSTVNGSFSFTTTGTFSTPSPATGCTVTTSTNLTCSYTPSRTFNLSSCTDPIISTSPSVNGLPTWFATNSWQNYIYYAVSSNCTSSGTNCTTASPQLTVGSKMGVHSLLISSGKSIVAPPFASSKAAVQAARPSCDVKDYLDSSENTNGVLVNGSADLVYDATNTARGSSYNDQMVTVAP